MVCQRAGAVAACVSVTHRTAHTELLFAYGAEQFARGEPVAAEQTITQALALCEQQEAQAKALDPEHVVDAATQAKLAQCYLERCLARTELERHADAMQDVAQVVVLAPRSAGAYSARGKVRAHRACARRSPRAACRGDRASCFWNSTILRRRCATSIRRLS